MAGKQIIETSNKALGFHLEWIDEEGAGRTRSLGALEAYIGRCPIWSRTCEQDSGGIRFLLIELLEHLARYWAYITLEQGFPFSLSPQSPSRLSDALADRWDTMPEDLQEVEEEIAFAFSVCHNLAHASPGSLWPDLWLSRDGGRFLIEGIVGSDPIIDFAPALEVKEVLTRLGDTIVGQIAKQDDVRSMKAVELWAKRNDIDAKTEARIVTGMNTDFIDQLFEDDKDVTVDWDATWPGENVFLDIAYRCKGEITPSNLRKFFNEIRKVSHHKNGAIKPLTYEMTQFVRSHVTPTERRPYKEGHRLANLVRALTHKHHDRIDPEALILSLGAQVTPFDFGSPSLDAIAVWAHHVQPIVYWNKSEKHLANEGARRATIAHELCHLLVDREDALTLSAVVGGAMERRLEQRANAFAAELLCPRAEAKREYLHDYNVDEAVRRLTSRFGVSKNMAAIQLARSNVDFNPAAKKLIEHLGPRGALYPWKSTDSDN